MRWIGALTGRQALVTQLCGSLTLDIAATRARLDWSPPLTVNESLRRTVDWFLAAGRERPR
jgi:nucleoside-diphosphate-sugar epimerase